MALVNYREIEQRAKALYGIDAAKEMCDYWGVDFNERTKKIKCRWHNDNNPSLDWNKKDNYFKCFSEETTVITKDGVKTIKEIIGKPVFIINGNGEWESVVFKSYGKQHLLKLTLTNGQKEKEIFTTPNHEWIVQGKKHKIETKDLKVGQRLEKMWFTNKGFTVKKIEETNRYEEVYCCETSTRSFVLEDFILTGNCFSCGKVYGIIDFYIEELGLNYWEALKRLCSKAGIEYDFMSERHNNRSFDYKYPNLDTDDMTEVYTYLTEKRGLTKDTIDYAKITSMKNNYGQYNIAFNFYDILGKLVGVKYRTLLPKGKEVGPRFFWQSDTSPCTALFNMNQCNPNNTLYITEGMMDALSIIEAGKKNVVSIPGGAHDYKWIDDNLEWLEQFEKIILWFDSDSQGIKGRNETMRRLGAFRTDYIHCTEKVDFEGEQVTVKDANELLIACGKERVLWYLDNPVQSEIDGIDDVADAEDFDIESAEGWYTGIKGIDNALYKGLFSTFGIISGFKGSGKSTFVNQMICEWLTQGYDTFIFSGELSLSRFKRWLERMMAGIDGIEMSNRGIPRISEEVQKKMRDWYRGHIHYFNTTKVEPTPENILERIEYLVRKKGIKFVIIDNLMTISFNCRRDEELSRQKEFCNKLMLLKTKYDLCVFLVDHPIKLADVNLIDSDHIRGTGDITNMADYILIIQRYMPEHKDNTKGWPKYLNPVEYNNLIRVRKNRERGVLSDVEVYFDYASSKFYQTPDELYAHFGWNTKSRPKGCTDPYKRGKEALIKKEIE